MARTPTKLKIKEKKLLRKKAYGVFYPDAVLIEIDPRLKPKHYLSILVHELLHYVFPFLTETQVRKAAPKIAKGIWARNYRKIAK